MSKDLNKISSSDNVKITPEALANGDVLCALIVRFLKNRTQENMMSVLFCLRDSYIFMPADVTVGGKPVDTNQPIYPTVQNVTIKPRLMKATDGNYYIPLFSREINAKAGELKNANLVNLPYVKCIDILEKAENCNRFVIDPFLYNFVLTENAVDISKNLPSRLDNA
ncbi:MAG: SseB family protein [Clostridia bacterium]|nr:SseB family protein [Clostridia bacterium]